MKELKGKIALIDFVCATREWQMMYTQYGTCPPSAHFPDSYKPARGAVTNLAPFVEAGALAVILVWTDISDENAMDQYTPFSRPPQKMPSLYVGRETGIKLSQLASAGAKATVVLEATTTPDTPTDTLMCTLKGASSDEAVICNSHTDGPNAIEENGPVGILALAKYFSSIPQSDRRRDMVFPLHTGHFALPWVPDVKGVVDKHPDLVKRTVAAVTVEHLACKEWIDDASLTHYRPTGQNCWDVTITKHKPMADLALAALNGKSEVHNTAVVNPLHGQRLVRRGHTIWHGRHSYHSVHPAAQLFAAGSAEWLLGKTGLRPALQPGPVLRKNSQRHERDDRRTTERRLKRSSQTSRKRPQKWGLFNFRRESLRCFSISFRRSSQKYLLQKFVTVRSRHPSVVCPRKFRVSRTVPVGTSSKSNRFVTPD